MYARMILLAGVALLVLFWALPAKADTASNGKDTATRWQTPCVDKEVLKFIPKEHLDKFRRGEAVINAVRYEMCWVEMNGWVLMQYGDGERGMVPVRDFRKDTQT